MMRSESRGWRDAVPSRPFLREEGTLTSAVASVVAGARLAGRRAVASVGGSSLGQTLSHGGSVESQRKFAATAPCAKGVRGSAILRRFRRAVGILVIRVAQITEL